MIWPDISAAAAAPTVYIVDDDASVRRSFERLIRTAGHRVETFNSALEFLSSGRAYHGVGCLVLDVQMPGLTGPALQTQLRDLGASLTIVFTTGHGTIPLSVQAMKDGAVDFLSKPVQSEDLLKAVNDALQRAEKDHARATELREIREAYATLTTREREVLTYVISGMLNKQIAAELGTAEKTIKVHRARILSKMGVQSVAQLVRRAEALGVPPHESGSGSNAA